MSTAAQKRAYRRRVLPGFPKEAAPMSLAQVREYFSCKKLLCLLCGRQRGNLGQHIKKIHDMEVDEYKEMYGLPWSRGLTSETAHANYSHAMIKRLEEGYSVAKSGKELRKMQDAAKDQRIQPFKIEVSLENLKKINK